MPATKRYYRKKKTTKKKAPKHVPKTPSKMTYKQLMKKTPEAYTDLTRLKYIMTPLRFTYQDGITGDATNAFAGDVISAVNVADPSAGSGTGQPYLFDQWMALYRIGHCKRVKFTVDYMDASTTEATAYYVYFVVDSEPTNFTTNPIQSVADLLESRERRIRPSYSLIQAGNRSTAGGRRRLKLEFDIPKALGIKRDAWDADELAGGYTFDGSGGNNYVACWYGLVSVDGAALPNTVGGRFTFKNRYLCKLFKPIDVGPSFVESDKLKEKIYDSRRHPDYEEPQRVPRNRSSGQGKAKPF